MNHDPVDLNLLKSFLAVSQLNGFLPAAEKIGRSPSAISMQIKRLEEVLGKDLFIRNARETVLTRDGERLVDYARHLLAGELEMRNAFRTEPMVGEVLLGVPDDVIERFPMSVLREFSDHYPEVAVTISVSHTPALLEAVERREIDLAIVTYAESVPGIRKAEMIYQEPEVWAALRGGEASKRKPLPVVLWEEEWAWYKNAIGILESVDINYSVVMKSENITARRNAIAADFAIGPLPASQLGDDLEALAQFKALPPLPSYALGLIVQNGASQPANALADYLRVAVKY